MTTTIRGAEPTDLEAVHAIFTGKNVIRDTLLLPHQTLVSLEPRLQSDDNRHCFVAVHEGEVVGFAEVQTYSNLRLAHVAHLNLIAVRDELQGKGIGTKLLETCIDLVDNYLLAHRFYLQVWAENRAVKLYKKYGFVIEGKHIDFGIRDGKYSDVLTMARIRN